MDIKGISERIKDARKSCGISQTRLAELLGLSDMTIRRWEAGKVSPRINEIEQIAKVLQTSEEYLIGICDTATLTLYKMPIPDNKNTPYTEKSKNQGMLVYTNAEGERFEAPPTDEGARYIIQMRAASKADTTIKN